MRDRLVRRFIEYVSCGSESRNERNFCLMMEGELSRLGISFSKQEIGPEMGSNGWIIVANLPGIVEKPPVLLVMHLDTVMPGDNIEPVIVDEKIVSKGNTILGGDGKSGIAIVLETLERLKESQTPHRPVELMFTPCQEVDILGIRHADFSRINSQMAIVLDHTNVGEIISESPYARRVTYDLFGKTAHAAMKPQAGANALKAAARAVDRVKVGQVDEDSIVNVGDFVSLAPTNTIPQHARFDVEIRSFHMRLLQKHMRLLEKEVKEACGEYGTTYTKREQWIADKITFNQDDTILHEMLESMRKAGVEGKTARTFGLCDALYLYERGIQSINVGTGTGNLHSTEEFVIINDMRRMVDVMINLLQA